MARFLIALEFLVLSDKRIMNNDTKKQDYVQNYERYVNMVIIITRDGGKWWSKDHHLVVVKIVKNVAFSLKNVKKW